jgi:AcrR family transcriptional regulator
MTGTKAGGRSRNRPQTEERLRTAVAAVLVQGGFGALSPSTVAREAGVDKMLIYRYFGSFEGLIEDVANGPEFFPGFDEVCNGDPAGLRAKPVPERAVTVAGNYARLLLARPVVLELMVWELVERNALTAIMETARETMGLRLAREIFDDADDPGFVKAFFALLGAGITYLALRRRKIRWFNGIDLRSDEGWDQLLAAVRLMAQPLETTTRPR